MSQHHHHHNHSFCPRFRCPCRPLCRRHHQHHHHHHHHHHHPFFCPFHSRFPYPNFQTHFPTFPIPPPTPANLNPGSSAPGLVDINFSTTGLQEGAEKLYEEEEEEEEEPVFVLTDEWMEFFAKSEAKRRLDKQQAKKRGSK
eukprot:TRINITY_DN828_c0_g1_i2.p1 TRINITY_DN828_c0_g1~~TRINITY_DN828_c0_g1_i2.p1  ORF type:complete len:142 (+),score=37.84 TRINITY_DN828_c0_g1_i2:140-565(+)